MISTWEWLLPQQPVLKVDVTPSAVLQHLDQVLDCLSPRGLIAHLPLVQPCGLCFIAGIPHYCCSVAHKPTHGDVMSTARQLFHQQFGTQWLCIPRPECGPEIDLLAHLSALRRARHVEYFLGPVWHWCRRGKGGGQGAIETTQGLCASADVVAMFIFLFFWKMHPGGGGVEKNSWYRRTALFSGGTPGGGGGGVRKKFTFFRTPKPEISSTLPQLCGFGRCKENIFQGNH